MAEDVERLQLRWRLGPTGCLVPLFVLAAAMFGAAALNADYAAELAEGRRGALIGITRAVSVGGVNLPLAAVTLYLAFESFRFAWRWADEYAVWADASGLRFHGSLFRPPMPWGELRSVGTATRLRGFSAVTVLVVERTRGRRIEIGGIEPEEAERFAGAVRERLGR